MRMDLKKRSLEKRGREKRAKKFDEIKNSK